MAREQETSAFNSEGFQSFPPTYLDNKDVRNFSDEKKWPTDKLIGRYALYHRFIARLDIMPRAKRMAERIISHIDFELPYRSLYLDFDFEDEDDCPTEPIDSNELKKMLYSENE